MGLYALDTNVLVRLAVNDSPSQVALAKAVIGTSRLWIGVSVLLETEWVLRSRYGYEKTQITALFAALLESAQFQLEDSEKVREAISLCDQGADFADALHLCRAPDTAILLTFDARFGTQRVRKSRAVQVLRS
jgi:predicted nucleic-acid-binding protein